jgi:hypothetical protein
MSAPQDETSEVSETAETKVESKAIDEIQEEAKVHTSDGLIMTPGLNTQAFGFSLNNAGIGQLSIPFNPGSFSQSTQGAINFGISMEPSITTHLEGRWREFQDDIKRAVETKVSNYWPGSRFSQRTVNALMTESNALLNDDEDDDTLQSIQQLTGLFAGTLSVATHVMTYHPEGTLMLIGEDASLQRLEEKKWVAFRPPTDGPFMFRNQITSVVYEVEPGVRAVRFNQRVDSGGDQDDDKDVSGILPFTGTVVDDVKTVVFEECCLKLVRSDSSLYTRREGSTWTRLEPQPSGVYIFLDMSSGFRYKVRPGVLVARVIDLNRLGLSLRFGRDLHSRYTRYDSFEYDAADVDSCPLIALPPPPPPLSLSSIPSAGYVMQSITSIVPPPVEETAYMTVDNGHRFVPRDGAWVRVIDNPMQTYTFNDVLTGDMYLVTPNVNAVLINNDNDDDDDDDDDDNDNEDDDNVDQDIDMFEAGVPPSLMTTYRDPPFSVDRVRMSFRARSDPVTNPFVDCIMQTVDLVPIPGTQSDEEVCSICQSELFGDDDDDEGDEGTGNHACICSSPGLTCGHMYHTQCLEEMWGGIKNCCIVCRIGSNVPNSFMEPISHSMVTAPLIWEESQRVQNGDETKRMMLHHGNQKYHTRTHIYNVSLRGGKPLAEAFLCQFPPVRLSTSPLFGVFSNVTRTYVTSPVMLTQKTDTIMYSGERAACVALWSPITDISQRSNDDDVIISTVLDVNPSVDTDEVKGTAFMDTVDLGQEGKVSFYVFSVPTEFDDGQFERISRPVEARALCVIKVLPGFVMEEPFQLEPQPEPRPLYSQRFVLMHVELGPTLLLFGCVSEEFWRDEKTTVPLTFSERPSQVLGGFDTATCEITLNPSFKNGTCPLVLACEDERSRGHSPVSIWKTCFPTNLINTSFKAGEMSSRMWSLLGDIMRHAPLGHSDMLRLNSASKRTHWILAAHKMYSSAPAHTDITTQLLRSSCIFGDTMTMTNLIKEDPKRLRRSCVLTCVREGVNVKKMLVLMCSMSPSPVKLCRFQCKTKKTWIGHQAVRRGCMSVIGFFYGDTKLTSVEDMDEDNTTCIFHAVNSNVLSDTSTRDALRIMYAPYGTRSKSRTTFLKVADRLCPVTDWQWETAYLCSIRKGKTETSAWLSTHGVDRACVNLEGDGEKEYLRRGPE